jgi:hypothetical protein
VDPEAETEDELEEAPPQAAKPGAAAIPAGAVASRALANLKAPAAQVKHAAACSRRCTVAAPWSSSPGLADVQEGKAGELAEMQRKMEALQEQVQRLQREAAASKGLNADAAAFMPAPAHALLPTSAARTMSGSAVDPRSVHVQGLSPLALPEVVAAHFSG